MATEPGPAVRGDAAQAPLAPGPTVRLAQGGVVLELAPMAGGRIAQIAVDGTPWLVGHEARHEAMIGWGSYPMLPWAGRIRHGRFTFEGHARQLPANLGAHAIHGVAFGLPWQVDALAEASADLSLGLPADARWPYGGLARQRIEVGMRQVRLELSVTAARQAMPAVIGWHPWFLKPDRMDFKPSRYYPRDHEGIARLPLAEPPPAPWDDCFLNDEPVLLHRGGQRLRLSSDCHHWVVYDETDFATCVEPQTGPPDAFNLGLARTLAPGETLRAWFLLEWL
jgi:aldose 1-epimerase